MSEIFVSISNIRTIVSMRMSVGLNGGPARCGQGRENLPPVKSSGKIWRVENLKISRLAHVVQMFCSLDEWELLTVAWPPIGPLLDHPASTCRLADSEVFNLKSINGHRTSVPVQKFKPGSGKVANVKSKAKASQGASWSTESKDIDVKKKLGQRQID